MPGLGSVLLLLAVAAALAPAGGVHLPPRGLGGGGGKQKRRDKDPGFDLCVFVRSYSPTFCRQEQCSIRPM